jgi:guanylate kinase
MNVTDIADILKDSTLRSMISDFEISEIAEEIGSEIQEYVEQLKEEITQDALADADVSGLKQELVYLQHELSKVKGETVKISSIDDEMTLDWIKENWDDFVDLYKMNKTSKDIKELVLDGEAFQFLKPHDSLEEILDGLKRVKRTILVGKAAAGKDHMRKVLESRGFKYAVSYTTRPPRVGEVDGKDYIFISEDQFKEMIKNGEFYEFVVFNNWYYGTTKKQFYSDDIFIMTPAGLSHVSPEDRKNSVVFYFDIPYEERKHRLSLRSDADSVERRLEADENDFKDFVNYDIKITDPNY